MLLSLYFLCLCVSYLSFGRGTSDFIAAENCNNLSATVMFGFEVAGFSLCHFLLCH